MRFQRRTIAIAAALVLATLTASVQLALAKKKEKQNTEDEQKRAVHALNRLTFGPRPGDVERVASMGVDDWINQQLHPDKNR